MKKIAHSLIVIGLSCWFLGGCVGSDMEGAGESEQALAHTEDAYQEQEALSHGEEDLYSEEDLSAAELEEEGDYETEYCSGFSGQGSVCHVRCSNYQWYRVGCYYGCSPFVDWGQCASKGDAMCRQVGQGPGIRHCWN